MAADSASILQQLDSQIEHILADWNIYTTLICLVLATYLIYPLFVYAEPDIHPLLLARQSRVSDVRQPGESAIFRSLETPPGYPLKAGLNVKDPGAPKWTSGRDGDLRDVWKKALAGPLDNDGRPAGDVGKVLTVFGRDEIIENKLESMSSEINAVGQHMKAHGGSRVALFLPSSVELFVTLFSAAFYGLTPILLPQSQPLEKLATILGETNADVLVARAGVVPLNELLQKHPNLKQVIWVVERTSRHIDWNEVAEGEGGRAEVAVWHEIIHEETPAPSELPSEIPGGIMPNVVIVSDHGSEETDRYNIVEYTQQNVVAAIGAQLSALPRQHRLAPTDLVVPLASPTETYPLIMTLTALFSNSSLILTSVSGPSTNYLAAFHQVCPTVIIAGTQTMSQFCTGREKSLASKSVALGHWWKSRSLEAGTMPKSSKPPHTTPRLIYTYDVAGASTVPLSTSDMFNLRIFTGARLVLALTDYRVAGAISQTNVLDYQGHGVGSESASHFGPPLSCLEIKLKETEHRKIDDGTPTGKLVVTGPAVVGGETVVDQVMTMTDANTLAYPH